MQLWEHSTLVSESGDILAERESLTRTIRSFPKVLKRLKREEGRKGFRRPNTLKLDEGAQ